MRILFTSLYFWKMGGSGVKEGLFYFCFLVGVSNRILGRNFLGFCTGSFYGTYSFI